MQTDTRSEEKIRPRESLISCRKRPLDQILVD